MSRLEPVLTFPRGVYLLDLTFIHEGNPDHDSGLINFSKRQLMASLFMHIHRFQGVKYQFVPKESLEDFFRSLRIPTDADEKYLHKLSVQLEAPANRQ